MHLGGGAVLDNITGGATSTKTLFAQRRKLN